ncbi:MAG: chemotaxis protein CheA [Phycisphaerales bacterium]
MTWQPDPSLLQDFLTEAGELIEKLDSDMVLLERGGSAAETRELLNGIFRALHTVKGAAGFLQLDTLIHFAHAAEDALNLLRQGETAVTPAVVDALLQSVDVLRSMIGELAQGRQPSPCDHALIARLESIAGRGQTPASKPVAQPAAQPVSQAAAQTEPDEDLAVIADAAGPDGKPLKLPAQKQAILELMVVDLRENAAQIAALVARANEGDPCPVAREIEDLFESVCRVLEFFELPDMTRVVHAAAKAAGSLQARPANAPDILVRLVGVSMLLSQLADGLEARRVRSWPTGTLESRLVKLASGADLGDPDASSHGGDVWAAMMIDGVVGGEGLHVVEGCLGIDPGLAVGAEPTNAADGETAGSSERSDAGERAGHDRSVAAEQTIRVEVSRLEKLLSLVGQLVLAKNRIGAIGRRMRQSNAGASLLAEVLAASGELDRLTGELQMGVMRTRMQPLAKLFDRYPRVIRDIARATGKQIELELSGKETEVDKSVLELLADPMVHMIRNSADHGIEHAADRRRAGKPDHGTISVTANHQGSHVRVEIRDDGRGIDPGVIGRKAVEKGLATADEVATMTPRQVIQFIFAPGFSTAETVTDLSGRGVGMDVVRTNVQRMGGSIDVSSEVGRGSRIEILIPLTVAIMPAMVVGVGQDHYCIPLQTITEIVRSDAGGRRSVAGQPVLHLRDEVLPLIELRGALGARDAADAAAGRFAVIVRSGSEKAGLVVDRLVGQQEIVIRPLEDDFEQGGPFSGATIRDEGDVSLILDVNRLMRRNDKSAGIDLAA